MLCDSVCHYRPGILVGNVRHDDRQLGGLLPIPRTAVSAHLHRLRCAQQCRCEEVRSRSLVPSSRSLQGARQCIKLYRLSYVLSPLPVDGLLIRNDAESRTLEVRCGMKKAKDSKKVYVHMLNGTLCATERALCCLVENFQTPTVCPFLLIRRAPLIRRCRVSIFRYRFRSTCKVGRSCRTLCRTSRRRVVRVGLEENRLLISHRRFVALERVASLCSIANTISISLRQKRIKETRGNMRISVLLSSSRYIANRRVARKDRTSS